MKILEAMKPKQDEFYEKLQLRPVKKEIREEVEIVREEVKEVKEEMKIRINEEIGKQQKVEVELVENLVEEKTKLPVEEMKVDFENKLETLGNMMLCLTVLALKSNGEEPNSKRRDSGSNSSSSTEATKSSVDARGISQYRILNKEGQTCLLMATDAVVDVYFRLHDTDERGSSFVPEKAFQDGKCDEDVSSLELIWKNYMLRFNFAKTPGGERWYISQVVLKIETNDTPYKGLKQKKILLYNSDMLIPTPVGKSHLCDEVVINLEPEKDNRLSSGTRGVLALRQLQVQPFMYRGEDFDPAFQCKIDKYYRSETAPIIVGSTLALAALGTITGYALFRYFKVKNIQYDSMT